MSGLCFPPVPWAVWIASLLALLLAVEAAYIPLARRLGIGARVTPRSSSTHRSFTPTGGGVVFVVAALLFFFFDLSQLPPHFRAMLIGGVLLAVVSFIDDIHDLPPALRLVVHAVVIAVVYLWVAVEPDAYLLLLILGVGFINAYNFMDGISGILTAYSIVVLATLAYALEGAYADLPPVRNSLVGFAVTLMVAAVAFGVFNFRRHSKVFCGDVGSITMGYFIMFLMVMLVVHTRDAAYVIFVIVYGVDTIFTIFERLFRGENILLSHRSHLYQKLANERGVGHITLSLGYAALQLALNVGFLLMPVHMQWVYVIVATSLLVAAYFVAKRALLPR